MRIQTLVVGFAISIACFESVYAEWQVYEETNVKGTISGVIKKDRILKMQSGSIYQVSDITLQIVMEIAPDVLVLSDGIEFKLIIEGFNEPLICKQLKAPAHLTTSPTRNQRPKGQTKSQNVKDIPLDKLMSQKDLERMGIQKLTKKEKENLRQFLIQLYLLGVEHGRKESSKNASRKPPITTTQKVIESRIDGDFEGWEGETVIKLMNGQIWQQTEYYYHYHYAYMPSVLIYRSGGRYKMKVDGIDKAVGVTQLK